MATLALAPYHDGPRTHFVSNVDGAHIADTLRSLDPATTLFIIASKTFTTVETMTNAADGARWVAQGLGEAAVGRHFCRGFDGARQGRGVRHRQDRVFGFWDWVGGRYSIWSAIGLPVMIAVGPDGSASSCRGAMRWTSISARTDPAKLADAARPHRCCIVMLGISVARRPALRSAPAAPTRLPAAARHGIERQARHRRGQPSVARPARWSGASRAPMASTPSSSSASGNDVVPAEFLIAANGHEPDCAHITSC